MLARNSAWPRGALCLAATLATAVPVCAHDLWLIPGSFALQPGETVRIFINSGDSFPTSDALINRSRVQSLTLALASQEVQVDTFVVDGKSLTAEVGPSQPGTSVLALTLEPRVIRLRAEDFNEYLADEKLRGLLELRTARGESNLPAVERYTKFAKAILSVGEQDDDRWSQPAGLKLEIVPRISPRVLRRGTALPFTVLFEGKPVSEVRVVGGRAGTRAQEIETVTDAQGESSVVLEEAGRWYLRVLHMIRLSDDDPEAQWESFWTTLTFEVQA